MAVHELTNDSVQEYFLNFKQCKILKFEFTYDYLGKNERMMIINYLQLLFESDLITSRGIGDGEDIAISI